MQFSNYANRSGEATYCYACMRVLKRKTKECPNCHSPVPYVPTNPQLLTPGTLLASRYLIGRPLGSGGFGATYIACDLRDNTVCAVKEFFPSGLCTRSAAGARVIPSPDEEGSFSKYLGSFLDESRRLQGLSGAEGVVRVTDSFQENGTAYYVMEYLSGKTLKAYMHDEPVGLSPQEVLGLIAQVLRGLSAVHAHGLLHRDVSADNIIRQEDGRLTLIDFGSARETQVVAKTVFVKGRYTAPEQKLGDRQGPYTDIYAVGVLLFLLLVGRLPAQNVGTLESINAAKRDLPPKVCALVNRAMQPNPAKRYQTAADMLRDAEECAVSLAAGPSRRHFHPDHSAPKPQKRRLSRAARAALLSVLALLAALIFLVLLALLL